jgi:trimethylamine--corrinoid protein Co-methyltransferase
MKTAIFEVLSREEIERIHAASMEVLATTGVQCDWRPARDLFRQAGARVDDERKSVHLPEELVRWAVEQAPSQFRLYGPQSENGSREAFSLDIGGDNVCFAGLGTPTHMVDTESGQRREATMTDVVRHIQIISSCQHIHNSQMDIWPGDVPMTTIHAEAIWAWAHNSHKSFGMGCYGYLPTLDMMRMMAIVSGGKETARRRPSFLAICSVNSPLQMIQMQLEGLLICADYGQPLAMSPEAIAGATAPVTLAGLLVQQNANILAHVTLAQIFRPGTPVLYGTVSTIANMRTGTVALGAVETGLITAGAAQLARYYGLPCRSVGGVTESKLEDLQAGMERTTTLLPAVLAGVNLITCGGTLDGTMLESEALLVLDDELCGAALRMARGIEVNEGTLALDLIKQIGFSGNYLAEPHTVRRFRREHYIPSLLPRKPYAAWAEEGSRSALDHARDRVREILDQHQPRELDPVMEKELSNYRRTVAQRPLEEFYLHEMEEKQDWNAL